MDERLLALGAGPIRRGDHPRLRSVIDRAVRRGQLEPVFPGIYCVAGAPLAHRVAALALADPDAVLTHDTARWLWGWAEAPAVVTAASVRRSRPGFELARRRLPVEEIVQRGPFRVTSAAATALDGARRRGADALDEALRHGVTLERLWDAFRAGADTPGNGRVRRLLLDSRSEPWSAAERVAHAALRRAGVTGWVANHRVVTGSGSWFFLDIAFRRERLAVEVDGWRHHHGPEAFEADRLRDLRLLRQGWLVVRLPARWVLDDPDAFAAAVADLRRRRARGLI